MTTLTLTNEAVVAAGKEKSANSKGGLKNVRDGGIRITIARDEGLDLLADVGELFDVRAPLYRHLPSLCLHPFFSMLTIHAWNI